jgi:hypothetical protein
MIQGFVDEGRGNLEGRNFETGHYGFAPLKTII